MALLDEEFGLVLQQFTRVEPRSGCLQPTEPPVVEMGMVAGGIHVFRQVTERDGRTHQQEIESLLIDNVANILAGIVRHLITRMDLNPQLLGSVENGAEADLLELVGMQRIDIRTDGQVQGRYIQRFGTL